MEVLMQLMHSGIVELFLDRQIRIQQFYVTGMQVWNFLVPSSPCLSGTKLQSRGLWVFCMTNSCCDWALWLVTAAHLSDRQKADLHFFFPFSTHPGTGTPASHDFCHACNVQARSPCCTPKVSGAGVKWLKYQKREVLNDWYVKLKEHQLVLPKRDFHAGQTCFNVLMFCCFWLLILLVPEVYWLCAPQPDAWPGKELYRFGNVGWQQKFAFMQASIHWTGMLWQRP